MNKKKPIALLLLSASLLVGCASGEGTSSSSKSQEETSKTESEQSQSKDSSSNSGDEGSSSSEQDDSISVSQAYQEIAKAQAAEISLASSTTYDKTEVGARLQSISKETYLTYQDGSTTSSGTLTRKEEGKEDKYTTFKRIATKQTDTYETDGVNRSYDMFVQVTDYADALSTNSSYSDSASKKFIIASKDDIGNLEDGEYILASDFGLYASVNLTSKLANFLASYVVDNYYAELCGKTKILPTLNEQGNWSYSLSYAYDYDEDGQNIATAISLSYTLSSDKSRLLDYSTESTVTYTNKSDSSDYSVSSLKESGAITYGDREASIGKDALNPDNYFLESVLSVGLQAKRASDWKWIDVSGNSTSGYEVSTACTQIVGYASSYEPFKALDTYLSPSASSDESVIALEDGVFTIKGTGTADLSFTYYRKMSSTGVYKLTTVKAKNVIVSEAKAEDISISSKGDRYFNQGLVSGESYEWSYRITPTQADQGATAASSDESVAKASVAKDGTLTVEAIGEGKATITLSATADPSVSTTMDVYVLPQQDYSAYLSSHTFSSSNPYGTTRTVAFSSDGTATVSISSTSTSEVVATDSITWTLSGTELTFDYPDGASTSLASFEDGRVIAILDDDGNYQGIGLSIGLDDYSTNLFTLVK